MKRLPCLEGQPVEGHNFKDSKHSQVQMQALVDRTETKDKRMKDPRLR